MTLSLTRFEFKQLTLQCSKIMDGLFISVVAQFEKSNCKADLTI